MKEYWKVDNSETQLAVLKVGRTVEMKVNWKEPKLE